MGKGARVRAEHAKESKRHRWIVVASYELSESQAKQATTPGMKPVNLDRVNRLGVDGPGCLDCEQTYAQAVGTSCTAEPFKLTEHNAHITDIPA